MAKILITGYTGMLGKDVTEIFSDDHLYDVYGISRHNNGKIKKNQFIGDITDVPFLCYTIDKIKPKIIVHCAANTNIDDCEKNKDYIYKLHVESSNLLSLYNPHHTKFIYISTDSVFDGIKGNYSESDKPVPLNYYAESKLKGEGVILKNNPNAIIIRTNIYGFHCPAKASLVEWALDNLLKNKAVLGFTDVYFNPVYTKQLSRIIKKIVEKNNIYGIINLASSRFISKYEFLVELSKVFGFSQSLISKASIEDSKLVAIRPRNTTLNIAKLNNMLNEVPDLYSGLLELKEDFERTQGKELP